MCFVTRMDSTKSFKVALMCLFFIGFQSIQAQETGFTYNASETSPTAQTEFGVPVVTIAEPKMVEKCDKKICVEDICRVNGSVSRPTFYARCPDPVEGEEDLTFYCMCATAYHVLASKETEPSYVPITPDINCQVPETMEDKQLCQQSKCEGLNKRQIKAVHICESNGKYYCACFN